MLHSHPDPWITWTPIRLWVVYHGQQFEAEASVVHTGGGHSIGISFEKIPPASLDLLTTWLRDLPSREPFALRAAPAAGLHGRN